MYKRQEFGCSPVSGLAVEDEEHRHADELQHGERRGEIEAQEGRCLAPDFNFEGRVPEVAEHEDHPERCEREEEHERRARQDGRSEQRKRDGAEHADPPGSEDASCIFEVRINLFPERSDAADHDGQVVEHMGDEDRPNRAAQVHAEGASGPEQSEECDPDDDCG